MFSQVSKNIQCTYRVLTVFDFNEETKKNGLSEKVLLTNPLEYTLQINDDKSIYFENDNLFDESEIMSLKIRRILSSNNIKNVYTDLKKNKIKENIDAFDEDFTVLKKLSDNNWIITNETKKIDQYDCIKAILKTQNLNRAGTEETLETIAYFAPKIPLRFGPLYYNGLPGLVIQVEEKSKIIQLTKILFLEVSKKIEEPKDGLKIFSSLIDFEKHVKSMRNSNQ